MFNRFTVETLINKIDLNQLTISEAKMWLKKNYGIHIEARTRKKFISELWNTHRKLTT